MELRREDLSTLPHALILARSTASIELIASWKRGNLISVHLLKYHFLLDIRLVDERQGFETAVEMNTFLLYDEDALPHSPYASSKSQC